MSNYKIETSNKQIQSITNIGLLTNIILSILKIVAGIMCMSMALVADGIHSVSDIATDLIVLAGIHFGSKQADSRHPYGHGHIETFSATAIAIILMLMGAGIIYKGSINIVKSHIITPSWLAILIAVISIITKEILYRFTRKIAVTTHSSALYANAWHHRSDALSSIIVVIGLVSTMSGFYYGDHIAAIVVGLMIISIGGRIVTNCFLEFAEVSVDEKTIEQITQIISANSQIHGWHNLRTRTISRELFLDLHILVDPKLNITTAHGIAENLEETLHQQINRPVNITVHVEPDVPELRK